ncbi:MAG: CotH kinase family protein, partial [Gammaproteobacteria bacterium]|nr:CotH kinase family protein [Gammaproteobacteria bacterium]
PVKWGSSTSFDEELLPLIIKGGRAVTYENLSALMDIDMLCRWMAVVLYAGIDDSGQGYYVRDHRAQGPPWSTINWDFDNAFVIDKKWPSPQGFRSRLLLPLKNSSTEFQKVNLLPSLQDILNHVAPLARLPQRVRELMAIYKPYLDEEFQAHLNQRCFRNEIPDSDEFMALCYHDRWKQLLTFVDTRMAVILIQKGEALFGDSAHVVRIEAEEHSRYLTIDTWPARHEYIGYYYEGSELSVGWKEPNQASPLNFEINGVPSLMTGLRTNVTEDLIIRIRKSGA